MQGGVVAIHGLVGLTLQRQGVPPLGLGLGRNGVNSLGWNARRLGFQSLDFRRLHGAIEVDQGRVVAAFSHESPTFGQVNARLFEFVGGGTAGVFPGGGH